MQNSATEPKINNFLSIIDTWPSYFENPDEGLGTTYERFILHRLFKIVDSNFNIESVVETPSFGMTGISGINSVWWAQGGKRVIVTDNNRERMAKIKKVWTNLGFPVQLLLCSGENLAFRDRSFDLAWNFAALWFLPDLKCFAEQIKTITKKVIFICVPNDKGIGYLIRKHLTRIPPALYLENIVPAKIRNIFSGHGWELWTEGFFDIPPWPDIPMKKEDLLKKVIPIYFIEKRNKNSKRKTDEARTTILDHYNLKNVQLEKNVLRFSFLENTVTVLKVLWGHHRYFIFVRKI
jgi:hypothetical protein